VTTSDQAGRTVLDFHRAAMLPRRSEQAAVERRDDLKQVDASLPPGERLAAAADLDLAELRRRVPGPHGEAIRAGMTWAPPAGDPVTEAPALARLSLNLAIVHADAAAAGRDRRLVYGGHAIGIAAGHLTRTLPNIATILAWHSCDHSGPVDEGDVLITRVEVEGVERLSSGGSVAHLRCRVHARDAGAGREVLDWRPVVLLA
jgi:acyl dehydratase